MRHTPLIWGGLASALALAIVPGRAGAEDSIKCNLAWDAASAKPSRAGYQSFLKLCAGHSRASAARAWIAAHTSTPTPRPTVVARPKPRPPLTASEEPAPTSIPQSPASISREIKTNAIPLETRYVGPISISQSLPSIILTLSDFPAPGYTIEFNNDFQKSHEFARFYYDKGDFKSSLYYLGEGCKKGDAAHCTSLGFMYEFGHGLQQKQPDKAFQLYDFSCNKDFAAACTNRGFLQEYGIGIDLDYNKSSKSYSQACFLGDARGCYRIGALFLSGKGVNLETATAARFFDIACRGNDAEGCSSLGYLSEIGSGVSASKTFAIELYRKALRLEPTLQHAKDGLKRLGQTP